MNLTPGETVLGGAFLPHAPQFFTRPDTEDAATVTRVENVAAKIGERLAALRPDVWVTISNDHTQQFFLHCAPPFALHVGGEARGSFAGREFRYDIASEVSLAVIRQLYAQGFDPAFSSTAEVDYALGIPLSHLRTSGPILPVFVNAYLPPQPTMPRCYAFGKAMAAALGVLGVRAVVVASGGMSHFPGTDRYARPDIDFDTSLLDSIRRGNLQTLAGLDERQLDESGNIELRCWAIAAGMLGERVPDILEFNPSWHHNYCSVAFWQPARTAAAPHYPATKPELVALTRALHGLAYDTSAREDYRRDAVSFAQGHGLPADHAKLLCAADFDAMVALGVHPLVSFLARMQLDREKAPKR
jgi:2,3-dihydroxyphenylpropionate 1,2-dioxygenase